MSFVFIFVTAVFSLFAIYRLVSSIAGGSASRVRAEYLNDEVREIEQLVARREVLLDALRELEFEWETNKVAKEDYESYKRRYEREAVAIMRRLSELHGGEGWEERIDAELETRLGRAPRSAALELEELHASDDAGGADDATADEDAEDNETDHADEPPSSDEDEAGDEDGVEAAIEEEPDADVTSDEPPAGDDADDEARASDSTEKRTNGEPESERPRATTLEFSCSNCGKDLEPEDAFCSKCGTPVTPREATEPATEEAR